MNHLKSYMAAMLFCLSELALAVDCTPELITLTSQADVNNFQINHGPGCDTVVGGLKIEGGSIVDLSPLSGLTTVSTTGPFGFDAIMQINNTGLTDLEGLENLADVYWIELNNNTGLTDISALSSLVTVRGPFFINGNSALINLNGLESLTGLPGGALIIENNMLLEDLSGVSNIDSINASLVIGNNDALHNLDDFSGLVHVSSAISISNNLLLSDIGALGGLDGFSGTLDIRSNQSLTSLGDLSNFTELKGLVIHSNPLLTNLNGLGNLTHLGNVSPLSLRYNNTLSNIEGLSNLISAEFDVEITNNPNLDDCSPLRALLDSKDDAEPGPGPGGAGVPDVGGDVTLNNNLPGCNSLPEPIEGTFTYGGFASNRLHLLFKGINISLNCFDTPLLIPDWSAIPAMRVQFACSAIPFLNTDVLVYDVAEGSCAVYEDFATGTDLFIDAVHLQGENAGAGIDVQAEAIFQQDSNALLHFDPQTGDLHHTQSMVCAEPGPSKIIFMNGFEGLF